HIPIPRWIKCKFDQCLCNTIDSGYFALHLIHNVSRYRAIWSSQGHHYLGYTTFFRDDLIYQSEVYDVGGFELWIIAALECIDYFRSQSDGIHDDRSEERRVGKERRPRWGRVHERY